MSNLSAYVSEIIEKVAANLKGNNKITEFNEVFFSLEAITQVIRNVISEEENVSIYNAPILFTYLTSVPFVLPEDENIIAEFKKLLEHFVQKSCEKLTVSGRSRPKLGTGRIKIIEILRFILKENILNTRDIVARTDNFFSILLNLFREYPLNNLLHNEIIKILEIALTEPEGSPLNAAVLKDSLLLNFISEEVEEDKKIKAGASVYKARKGFIAHLINLSIRLRELAENNQNIRRLIESTLLLTQAPTSPRSTNPSSRGKSSTPRSPSPASPCARTSNTKSCSRKRYRPSNAGHHRRLRHLPPEVPLPSLRAGARTRQHRPPRPRRGTPEAAGGEPHHQDQGGGEARRGGGGRPAAAGD